MLLCKARCNFAFTTCKHLLVICNSVFYYDIINGDRHFINIVPHSPLLHLSFISQYLSSSQPIPLYICALIHLLICLVVSVSLIRVHYICIGEAPFTTHRKLANVSLLLSLKKARTYQE